MRKVLEEFYYGNITPNQKSFTRNSPYAKAMAWEKMDCFVDVLALELAISDRAESNIYLLYDDKEVFEKVLEMLNEIMQQENLNRYDKT